MKPLLSLILTLLSVAAEDRLPNGPGLAAQFPGDAGIEKHANVVFVENFEVAKISDLNARWSAVVNKNDALQLDPAELVEGTSGKQALKITATKGKNEGGQLNKVLSKGYEELFVRLYVKFDEAYGFNHHFCKLGGELKPTPWPAGRAGLKPQDYFLTGLEPTASLSHTWPPKPYAPPGYWSFYTYYPEMRSWQTPEGATNGKPNAYYGNRFATEQPAPIERGKWICVEWSVKLNSTPEKSDGAQRFWIDGKLIGDWAPGTPLGSWMRDVFRIRPDLGEQQKPFEGFKWRTNPDVKLNIVRLENYVSDTTFKQIAAYKAEHPDCKINTEQATVWLDHLVVATEYIGPLAVRPEGAK